MFPKLFAITFISLSFGAHAAPPKQILNTATQQNITPEQLAADLSQADIVLIGEQHDNPTHHAAQLWLLQHTQSQRNSGSVVLEMLTPEQQGALDEVQQWLQQGGATGKRSLAEKIQWNSAWDWSQYQNLMYYLLRQKTRVIGGNAVAADLQRQQNFLPQGKNSGSESVRQALGQLMHSHHGSAQNLVAMQQYKDYRMSQTLLDAPKPAWLLAGNIHVSKQLGVPLFLRDQGFAGRLKVVLLTDKDSEVSAQHADYVWYF